MKRDISMKLDGTDIVQTTAYHTDDGEFERRSVSRLGHRDTVLAQWEKDVAEALKTRDAMAAPAAQEPPMPGDGKPGIEVTYWLDGRDVCKCEVRRDAKGKVTQVLSHKEGSWAQRLENAEERLAEISEVLDKAQKAT